MTFNYITKLLWYKSLEKHAKIEPFLMRTCTTSLVSESDNAESENHSVESGKSDHTLKNWQYQEWKIDGNIIKKKSLAFKNTNKNLILIKTV